jgi:hypothetical protein
MSPTDAKPKAPRLTDAQCAKVAALLSLSLDSKARPS